MASFGNFGNVFPDGGAAVEQALQRRRFGDSVSPLSQVAPGTPQPNPAPTPQAPQTNALPPSAPMPNVGGVSAVGGLAGGMKPESSEAQLIVRALTQRLKNLPQF